MNTVINMIKFFRKIRKGLLSEGKLNKYLLYAFGEILLVVIGILIALQINNLNEDKKDRQLAKTYLNNLKLDLESDLISLETASKNLDNFETKGYYSFNVLDGKIKEIDTVKFLKSLVNNCFYHMYQPSRSTYEDLIGSGNIKLIENNDLKVALSKYYTRDDWMGEFSQRAKDTYWYVMREEMLKSVDPFTIGAYYESAFNPESVPKIKYEDIEVNFSEIKNHKTLINAIKRALSLRIWHRKQNENNKNEIDKIIKMLGN